MCTPLPAWGEEQQRPQRRCHIAHLMARSHSLLPSAFCTPSSLCASRCSLMLAFLVDVRFS